MIVWNVFFTLLNEAADYLREADAINPEDPEICARMIRVLMGLQAEAEVVQSYFDAAIALVPDHLMAHLMMINHLNPKWGGTIEGMYEFANSRYAKGGNSLLVVLKLFAIAEEQLYYGLMNEKEKQKTFFENKELRTNLLDLYNNYHEQESGKLLIPYVYNYFAYLLYRVGERQVSKELIKKIVGKMTIYPWAYMNIDNNRKLQQLV